MDDDADADADADDLDLTGETIAAVREQSTYDLVLEFESGRVLTVYDAKWHLKKGERGDQDQGQDPEQDTETEPGQNTPTEETLFAAEKEGLPDIWHDAFDQLVGQGRAPSSVRAAIEYVTTPKTQAEAAEEFGVNVSTVRDLQSTVVDVGPKDGVAGLEPRDGDRRIADLAQAIAEVRGWEEGTHYGIGGSLDHSANAILYKPGWRDLYTAVVALAEHDQDQDRERGGETDG